MDGDITFGASTGVAPVYLGFIRVFHFYNVKWSN